MNAIAALDGSARLPRAPGLLRYLYLTHVSVPEDDPRVLAALLGRIHATYRRRGYHFLSAFVMRPDPLAGAFRRYRGTRLPATLYGVSAPGGRFLDFDLKGARPGFEMCLV